MSVHNGEKFLEKSILSILRQTYDDFEFIIVDDGSNDSTAAILNTFKDPRLTLLTNIKNIGLTRSLNKALARSRGTYIARMDADDISKPERLKSQLSYLEKNSALALVGCWGKLIDSKGKIIGEKTNPQSHNDIFNRIMFHNPFIHPSVMFRKKIIKKLGMYDEKLDGAEDYDFFLRIAKSYEVQNIPKFLIYYRIVKEGVSWNKTKKVECSTLKAKIKAIYIYGYPLWYSISILKGIIMYMVPTFIKKWAFFNFIYR